MADAIYVLVDTDDVRDYLMNHADLIDDDCSMDDEQFYYMVERIVERSKTRLREMLVECFRESWMFVKLLDAVDDCMYDLVSEAVEEIGKEE